MINDAIHALRLGKNLSSEETRALFDVIFDGKAKDEQIAELLLALKEKGETSSELKGAVTSMRTHMLSINAPTEAIDIVGTGGDSHGTLNISTAASFVAAGAGVIVAKHGNRAVSSLSGASDVLGELGVNLECDSECLEKALNEIGIAFLFAPNHHPAMRHVAGIRKKLGVRTIFNLLGPLTNPASVTRHLIGVYDPVWMKPMAQTLAGLGSDNAWIVHGADGMDELSTTGSSSVVELKDGKIEEFLINPEKHNLPRAKLDDLKGTDPEGNALELRILLDGKTGPYRDIVLLNAGAALVVAEKAKDLAEGINLAAASIDNGSARHKLEELIEATNA